MQEVLMNFATNFATIDTRTIVVRRGRSRTDLFSRLTRYPRKDYDRPLEGRTQHYKISVEIVALMKAMDFYSALNMLHDGNRRLMNLLELLSYDADAHDSSMCPLFSSRHGIRVKKYSYDGVERLERELVYLSEFDDGKAGPGTRFATALLTDVDKGTFSQMLDMSMSPHIFATSLRLNA